MNRTREDEEINEGIMKQDLLNKTQLILKYGNEKINTKNIIFNPKS